MNPLSAYIKDLQGLLDRLPLEKVYQVIRILSTARLTGAQIFIMGNGGSASTASHFACDLSKNTRSESTSSFRVICLMENLAVISAFANDEGYSNIFSGQLAPLVQPGDVVIGISTSGNSLNVIEAIRLANQIHATTIAFTGFDGGQLGPLVDVNVHVPSDCIEHVEDVHLMLEHLICKVLRAEPPAFPISSIIKRDESCLFSIRTDWGGLMRRTLKLAVEGLNASSGSIIMFDEDGQLVGGAIAFAGTFKDQQPHEFSEIFERGLAGWVSKNRCSALVQKTNEDPRWYPSLWDSANGRTRSAIAIPLITKDRLFAILTVVNTRSRYTMEDLAFLNTIARCMFFVDIGAQKEFADVLSQQE
jgi:D-sedoheptulose 7-phosphate isomerase